MVQIFIKIHQVSLNYDFICICSSFCVVYSDSVQNYASLLNDDLNSDEDPVQKSSIGSVRHDTPRIIDDYDNDKSKSSKKRSIQNEQFWVEQYNQTWYERMKQLLPNYEK